MALQIITYPDNKRVWKSLIVSKFNGVDFEQNHEVKFGVTNRTDEFLNWNPFGQVPTLRINDQQGVFESNSIARYLARIGEKKKQLYGKDAVEASRIDGFLDVAIGLEEVVGPWFGKVSNAPWAAHIQQNQVTYFVDTTKKQLRGWNQALKGGKKWLVGDSISLADIIWFCVSYVAFSLVDADFRKEVPDAVKHFKKLEALPEFKSVIGQPAKFVDKSPHLSFDQKSEHTSPPRYHKIVHIAHGSKDVKFKFYSESTAQDIQQTIRSRFGLSDHQTLVLIDDEGYDVVVDGTIETAKYTLVLPGKEAQEGKEGKLSLLYFPIRGRAEAIRLVLEDTKTPYDDKFPENWSEKERKAGIESGDIPFGQVPAIKDGDFPLVQSNAILRYLGRKLGLYGHSLTEHALIDEVMDEAEDMRVEYGRLIYDHKLDAKAVENYLANQNKRLALVEKFLSRNEGGKHYLVGKDFTIADASWFELLEINLKVIPKFLDKYPLLKALHARIASRPNIAAYVVSGRRPKKVNNNGLGD